MKYTASLLVIWFLYIKMKPGNIIFFVLKWNEKWFYAVPQDKNENKCKKLIRDKKKCLKKSVRDAKLNFEKVITIKINIFFPFFTFVALKK